MAKVKAGKVLPKLLYGDPEASRIIHNAHAVSRLAKAIKNPKWKMARATATDKRVLIGNCHIFKAPK